MDEAVPTVEIVNPKKPSEFLVINAEDFDPKKHKLWEDPDKAKAKPATPPPPEKK